MSGENDLKEELIKRNSIQKSDNVNHPKHYADTCSLECIEAMEIAFGKDAVIAFCKCNAFKYIWRYQNKNGKEDLEKAMWYCDRGLELINECGDLNDFQINGLVKYAQEKYYPKRKAAEKGEDMQ